MDLKIGDSFPLIFGEQGANFQTGWQANQRGGGKREGRETHGNKFVLIAPEPSVQEPKTQI